MNNYQQTARTTIKKSPAKYALNLLLIAGVMMVAFSSNAFAAGGGSGGNGADGFRKLQERMQTNTQILMEGKSVADKVQ